MAVPAFVSAVRTARVPAAAAVVAAMEIRRSLKASGKVVFNALSDIPRSAAYNLYAESGQGVYRAAANASANEGFNAAFLEQPREGAVAGASAMQYAPAHNGTVDDVEYRKLRGMPEVLKYLSIL